MQSASTAPQPAALRLYHAKPSLCSQKVRLACAEKGVAYESQIVDLAAGENLQPEYVRVTPQLVVPVLEHNGEMVRDSLNIIRYVDRTFEGPALVPAQAADVAEMDVWLDLMNKLPLDPFMLGSSRLIRFVLLRSYERRTKMLEKFRTSHPELGEVYTQKIASNKALLAKGRSNEAMQAAIKAVVDALDRLDAHLAAKIQKGLPLFIVGTGYTLADVGWTVVLGRVSMSGQLAMIQKRPALRKYWSSMKARPSFRKAGIHDQPPLAQMLRRFRAPLAIIGTGLAAAVCYGVWRVASMFLRK